MNLCSDNHQEVCYEGRHCPACSVIEEKNYEIDNLKDKIKELEGELNELRNE